MTDILGKLSGGAGTGGGSVSLQNELLRFGVERVKLQLNVGYFTELLVNGRPMWEAYNVLMGGTLINLDNQAGVWLVRLGETWRRLMEVRSLHIGLEGEGCVRYRTSGRRDGGKNKQGDPCDATLL